MTLALSLFSSSPLPLFPLYLHGAHASTWKAVHALAGGRPGAQREWAARVDGMECARGG